MKIHRKKKLVRALWKKFAKDGMMNRADGSWSNRSSAPDNAMKRDFSPQSGK